MTNLRAEIHKKASAAYVQYAIFRWESATVLAGTLLLTALLPSPFPWWPIWAWPLSGVVALAAVVYSSLTDPETSAKVLWQLLRQERNPELIEDAQLRERVEVAFTYQRRIEADVLRARGAVEAQMESIAVQFARWIDQLFRLARYIDTYQRDYRLEERRKELPGQIESLMARRKFERNPDILKRLDKSMEELGRAWQTLGSLEAQMKQGPPTLERHLAAMARVYSEIRLLAEQGNLVEGQPARVQALIQEYIDQLDGMVGQIHALYTEALGDKA